MSLFDFRKHYLKLKIQIHRDHEPTEISSLCKQFSVDPKLVSFELLRRLVAKAFQISSDFNISYLSAEEGRVQSYIPLLSDWDVDAALFSASNSVLHLKVDLRPREAGFDEWDIIVPADVPSYHRVHSAISLRKAFTFFPQLSLQVEKTMNVFQRIFSDSTPVVKSIEHSWKPTKSHMSNSEMQHFMDNEGRLTNREAFRRSVYLGGMRSSVRKVGWQLLLHICPDSFTAKEREAYLAQQTRRYSLMKKAWKEAFMNGHLTPRQVNLINGISLDVVRTDSTHQMFSSENFAKSKVSELFNLMVTYSLYHPSVGYCQGMSDLASPFLLTQGGDEGAAYVCFCALMRRVKSNFAPDGEALVTKLQHLHDMVVYYDSPLAAHLRECGLGNMYFAHRWLLVELKREFRLEDSLRFLEVQWASLPNENVMSEFEWLRRSSDCAISESNNNLLVDPNLFHFLCARSSHSSSNGETPLHSSRSDEEDAVEEEDGLLESYEELQVRELWRSVSVPTHTATKPHLNNGHHAAVVDCFAGHDLMLMNSLIGKEYQVTEKSIKRHSGSRSSEGTDMSSENRSSLKSTTNGDDWSHGATQNGVDYTCSTDLTHSHSSEGVEAVKNSCEPPHKATEAPSEGAGTAANKGYGLIVMKDGVVELPTPSDLGYGNPFLQFLCLSLLLEYREAIFRNVKEAFDFSQLFRHVHHKHNVTRVLGRARKLYEDYLHDQNTRRKQLDEFPEVEVSL